LIITTPVPGVPVDDNKDIDREASEGASASGAPRGLPDPAQGVRRISRDTAHDRFNKNLPAFVRFLQHARRCYITDYEHTAAVGSQIQTARVRPH
jgi:hypothetical protein